MTDIAVGVLPIPLLKELQLPNRQRYALIVVFALGGLYVNPPPDVLPAVRLTSPQHLRSLGTTPTVSLRCVKGVRRELE